MGIFDAVMAAGEEGKKSGIAKLMGQAYNAAPDQRQGLMSEIARRDGPSAFAAQKQFGEQEQTAYSDLAREAGMFVSLAQSGDPAMTQQAYARLAQKAQAAGHPVPPQYDPKMLPMMQKLASVGQKPAELPNSVQEYQYAQNNPGYQEFLNGRQPTQLTSINVPGGSMQVQWNPRTKSMSDLAGNPLNLDGSPMAQGGGQAPAPQGAQPPPVETGANGEPIAIDPSLPPSVQAAIRNKTGDFQQGATVQTDTPSYVDQSGAPVTQGGGGGGGGAAPSRLGFKPDTSPAQAQAMELARQSSQRAAEAAQRAQEAADRARLGNAPAGQRFDDKGNLVDIPGARVPNAQLTDGQRNAAGFYSRMVNSDQELDAISKTGYDPTNLRDYATVGNPLLNGAASATGQQYHQAAQNWVRANLRKESGAAIGAAEMEQEIKNYFPQFGDKPEVVRQKAHNRKVLEDSMRTAAGAAIPSAPQATQASGGWSVKRVK